MTAASASEQERLASQVGTSRAYLYHLAAGEDKRYNREPKPKLAAAIERATAIMSDASQGRLPRVFRTDLVQACAECDFARQCLAREQTTVADAEQAANA